MVKKVADFSSGGHLRYLDYKPITSLQTNHIVASKVTSALLCPLLSFSTGNGLFLGIIVLTTPPSSPMTLLETLRALTLESEEANFYRNTHQLTGNRKDTHNIHHLLSQETWPPIALFSGGPDSPTLAHCYPPLYPGE